MQGELGDHTVIPFSVATKRLTEILGYRAGECRARLQLAEQAVRAELVSKTST